MEDLGLQLSCILRKHYNPNFLIQFKDGLAIKNPFDFSKNYIPAEGIDRFASGTPSILSMAAMEAGVDLVLEAEIKTMREKKHITV